MRAAEIIPSYEDVVANRDLFHKWYQGRGKERCSTTACIKRWNRLFPDQRIPETPAAANLVGLWIVVAHRELETLQEIEKLKSPNKRGRRAPGRVNAAAK